MKLEEAAAVLGVSRDTVKRDWRFAKLWLLRELEAGTNGSRPADARSSPSGSARATSAHRTSSGPR